MTSRCAARGNESLYREVNERIEHLKSGWPPLPNGISFVSVGMTDASFRSRYAG